MDKETYGYGGNDSVSTFYQVDNKLQQQLAEVTNQAVAFAQKVGGASSLVLQFLVLLQILLTWTPNATRDKSLLWPV